MITAEMIIPNKMKNRANQISLRSAALLAGIGLLIMVIAAPFAELYVYPKLIIPGNAAETVKNILENKSLFASAIFSYLITFICDVLVAWALYVFLKPVNEPLSRLTAWFRLVYTGIALVALLNLVSGCRVLSASCVRALFRPDEVQTHVMLCRGAFRSDWYFGLL